MPKILTIVIIFLLILALGVGLIWPKFQESQSLNSKIKAKRNELQALKEYHASLLQASQEIKNYEEPISKINSALPQDPSLPDLFNFIQKASSENGLVLKDLGSYTTVAENNFRKTNLSFEVSGSYTSFKNFLSALEKSSRLIEVEAVSFSAPQKVSSSSTPKKAPSPTENIFAFKLTIKVYSY